MRTVWIVGGWLIVAAIVYFSLIESAVGTDMRGGDKLGHLIGYATLMAWWSQLYVATGSQLKLAVACVALGAAMELAQAFTPDRQPEWLDLAANTAGVLVGWLAAPPRLPRLYRWLAAFHGTPR